MNRSPRLPLPYHPLLVAAFPVLFVLAHNPDEARAQDALLPLAVFLAAGVLLWAVSWLLLRRTRPAALVATFVLFLFSSYGHVFQVLRGISIAGHILGRSRFLLPAWLVLMAVCVAWVALRRRGEFARATRLANLFSLTLVVMMLAQIAVAQLRSARIRVEEARTEAPLPSGNAAAPAATGDLPDIYYIIPDSYSASSSLESDFGLDNSAFEDTLRARGFFIASRSRSNYAFTALSLASSLNMRYLDTLAEKMGENSTDKSPAEDMVADNAVMRFLKNKGYVLINAGSWWGPTNSNRNADINLRASRVNEFILNILQGTLLYSFSEEFVENDLRNKVLFTFRNLSEIPRMEAPTFTLAHVICPHPPYVFGPDGGRVPTWRRILNKSDSRALYRDQVVFVNRLLAEAVDRILAASPKPPLIIIQGDHGAAYTYKPYGVSSVFPDDHYLRIQMRIFNAYYLPGAPAGTVYDSITPVNSFRAVFNSYFGTKLPLLPDESFYSTVVRPYRLVNVTKKAVAPRTGSK